MVELSVETAALIEIKKKKKCSLSIKNYFNNLVCFAQNQRAGLKKSVHHQLLSRPGSAELTGSPLAPCVTSHPLRGGSPARLWPTTLDLRLVVSLQQWYNTHKSVSWFLSFACPCHFYVCASHSVTLGSEWCIVLVKAYAIWSWCYRAVNDKTDDSVCEWSCVRLCAVTGVWQLNCWLVKYPWHSRTLFELRRSATLQMSCCIEGGSRKSPASCPHTALWRSSAVHQRCHRVWQWDR